MKLLMAGIILFFIVEVNAQWYHFPGEAIGGARDMLRAYNDMREANWKESDKYFHARGNQDAANRGAGGRWAAEVISDAREGFQQMTGHGAEDSEADQRANEYGRNGGDLSVLRPAGLPEEY